MTKACWCYTTDEGYLLPTLVSAGQLKASLGPINEDIVVVCFGPETAMVRAAMAAAHETGVRFLSAPMEVIRGSGMICARLYLGELLDPAYETITYLDGDTQVTGPVAELSGVAPQPGDVYAVPDLMALMVQDEGRAWRARAAYFRGICIDEAMQARYVNSGVIKARRSDWEAVSRECLALLASPQSAGYAFRDQDALNVVLGGRQKLLSLRWNFPGYFLDRGIESIVTPRVIHFMSNPRPWDGPFSPWGDNANRPYRDFVAAHPGLKKAYAPLRSIKALRYNVQQRVKQRLEDWGSPAMRERIVLAERDAVA